MLRYPPLLTAAVAGAAAFVAASVRGLELSKVGAGAFAVEDGATFGALFGGLALVATTLLGLGVLRAMEADRALRMRLAAAMLAAGVLGTLAAAALTVVGARLGAGLALPDAAVELVRQARHLAPLPIAGALSSFAIFLTSR